MEALMKNLHLFITQIFWFDETLMVAWNEKLLNEMQGGEPN